MSITPCKNKKSSYSKNFLSLGKARKMGSYRYLYYNYKLNVNLNIEANAVRNS